ncbi:MAG: single-stranded DNA-binding protein [Bacteroidetes bacterium]|nr:MAG: single-stranded DNA-binding protein [Bacteroidota bacterium]TNE97218.1 MAG: single-stranded DNA-binding protein [Bacteroidota bacterium]
MQTLRNNITLIGNMGSDAQITNFENGAKVARFQIATSDAGKTNWHKVFAWGNIAQFIESYGKKGRELAIHGRLVKRTYLTKTGKQQQVTEVEVKHVIGL